MHFLDYKLPFFAQKSFKRYTPETIFEEYINFKIFCVLRHCGVVSVQSFRSYMKLYTYTPRRLD